MWKGVRMGTCRFLIVVSALWSCNGQGARDWSPKDSQIVAMYTRTHVEVSFSAEEDGAKLREFILLDRVANASSRSDIVEAWSEARDLKEKAPDFPTAVWSAAEADGDWPIHVGVSEDVYVRGFKDGIMDVLDEWREYSMEVNPRDRSLVLLLGVARRDLSDGGIILDDPPNRRLTELLKQFIRGGVRTLEENNTEAKQQLAKENLRRFLERLREHHDELGGWESAFEKARFSLCPGLWPFC